MSLPALSGWFSFTTDVHQDLGRALLETSLVCDTSAPVENVWCTFASYGRLFSASLPPPRFGPVCWLLLRLADEADEGLWL